MLLRVRELPASQLTLFLASETPGFVAGPGGSIGNLCLSGAIGRFLGPGEARPSTAAGTVELGIDLGGLPQPTMSASVMAGQTWRFQAWHRDQVGGQPGSSLSDAVAITF
ncbi:MAG: hypothetical protein ACJAZN_000339 [Planctomycetota bacterium]